MSELKWKPKRGKIIVKSIIRKFVMDAKTKSMNLDFVIDVFHKKFHFHAHTDCYDGDWAITCSKKNFSWDRKRNDVVGYYSEHNVGYIGSAYWHGDSIAPIAQALLQIIENYEWFWFDYFSIWDQKELVACYWRDLDAVEFYKYEPNEFSWVYNM